MNKNEEYLLYLEEHIGNVKFVWEQLQPLLKGEFKLKENDYDSLSEIIKHHDESKYSSEEFNPYCQYFYPEENKIKNSELFNQGWNSHQKTNKHHWQYWVLIQDTGEQVALEMSFYYIIELLCDWAAMSIKFKSGLSDWYSQNKHNMIIADKTRACIEKWMPLFEKIVKERK